ncbi:hypothetical protein EVAR_92394_1 [Eumeta japonica]|uniref:Uncharacterized protein n=1 Tax=Eumeta variegata TaxID=151549 RepID=A0A4C1TLZ8_EUMVA|nr:hypothetical protein EVAR_92394_1 [Eumeta japonica]
MAAGPSWPRVVRDLREYEAVSSLKDFGGLRSKPKKQWCFWSSSQLLTYLFGYNRFLLYLLKRCPKLRARNTIALPLKQWLGAGAA